MIQCDDTTREESAGKQGNIANESILETINIHLSVSFVLESRKRKGSVRAPAAYIAVR